MGSWRKINNFRPKPIQVLSSILSTDPNDPDALIFDLTTIMIATGLNVLESLLSIDMIN